MDNDVLQVIINDIDFKELPEKYIAGVSVMDDDGKEEIYTGGDIRRVLNGELSFNPEAEVMFMVDTHAIYKDVQMEYLSIFQGIYKLMKADYGY